MQGDRKLKISEANSHSSQHWKPLALTFSQFVDRLSNWKSIPVSPLQYNNLPRSEQSRLKNVGGYVLGQLNGNRRSITNTETREGLNLDFDKISQDELTKIQDKMKDSGLNYVLHSTASYNGQNGNVRVIVPFAEAVEAKSFAGLSEAFLNKLGLPNDDEHAHSPAQMMYWPTKLEGVEPVFQAVTNARYLDAKELTPLREERQISVYEPVECLESVSDQERKARAYEHAEAIEIVRQYTKRESKNLEKRENYLSALQVITYSFQQGLLELNTAHECVLLLACENEEWRAGNIKDFEQDLKKPVPKPKQSFMEKFNNKRKPAEAPRNFLKYTTNAGEILVTDYPKKIEFVPNMFVDGLTILAAPPKSGKSWFCLDAALSICRGGSFLGRETKQTPVLYLALEDSPARIKRRMQALRPFLKPDDVRLLDISHKAPQLQRLGADGSYKSDRTIDNDLLKFFAYWRALGKKVFFVDVFQKVRAGSGNMNQYESEYREAAPLQEWAIDNQAAVVLLHHFKKGTVGVDNVERVGGSTALTGAADTIITFEKADLAENKSLITITGRDVETEELECRFNNGSWIYEGTIAEGRQEAKRHEYDTNPIIRTIRHLLAGKKEIRYTASELTQEMIELCKWASHGVKIDKRAIGKLQHDLYLYDGISYEYNGNNNRREHIFKMNEPPPD